MVYNIASYPPPFLWYLEQGNTEVWNEKAKLNSRREKVWGTYYYYLFRICFNSQKIKFDFPVSNLFCLSWYFLIFVSPRILSFFMLFNSCSQMVALTRKSERVVGLAGGRGQSTTEGTQSDIESSFSTFLADVDVQEQLGSKDASSVFYLNYSYCYPVLDKILLFCCSVESKGEYIVEFLQSHHKRQHILMIEKSLMSSTASTVISPEA